MKGIISTCIYFPYYLTPAHVFVGTVESLGGSVKLSSAPQVLNRAGSSENLEHRHLLSINETGFTVISLSKRILFYSFICYAITISQLKLCFRVLNVYTRR